MIYDMINGSKTAYKWRYSVETDPNVGGKPPVAFDAGYALFYLTPLSLAKTFRDELMVKLDARWPEYGFAKHKGYGTKEHREALAKFGPCPLHRPDFHGVLPPKKQEQGWLC